MIANARILKGEITAYLKINFLHITVLQQAKVKLSLCLTNYALSHEGIWGVDV
jgi:hypothetical protein